MDIKYKIFLEYFYNFSEQSKYGVEKTIFIEYLVKEQKFSEVEAEEMFQIAHDCGKILERREGFFVRV